ncbi:MAG: imelysin family protein [Bacteroidota bacterium]
MAGAVAACDSEGSEDDRAAVRQALLSDLANSVIDPLHKAFEQDAATLQRAVVAFTSDPSQPNLETAQNAWVSAAVSWRKLAALNLPGPVRSGIFHNRINTWPANVDFIEDAIATTDTVNEAYVERLGSSSRGLPGLEYLLFEGGTTAVIERMSADSQRRAYVLAVAQNVASKAGELTQTWSRDGGNQLAAFELANTEGRSLQSSISRIVNEMAMVAEDLRHVKLGAPLGIARNPDDPNTAPRPERVEAPYAEVSVQLFSAEVDALRAIITANGGTGLDDYLVTLDAEFEGSPLGEVILAQLDRLEAEISGQTGSLKALVQDNPDALMPAYAETGQLLRLVKADLANWLGVSITFSDNDGDS